MDHLSRLFLDKSTQDISYYLYPFFLGVVFSIDLSIHPLAIFLSWPYQPLFEAFKAINGSGHLDEQFTFSFYALLL